MVLQGTMHNRGNSTNQDKPILLANVENVACVMLGASVVHAVYQSLLEPIQRTLKATKDMQVVTKGQIW